MKNFLRLTKTKISVTIVLIIVTLVTGVIVFGSAFDLWGSSQTNFSSILVAWFPLVALYIGGGSLAATYSGGLLLYIGLIVGVAVEVFYLYFITCCLLYSFSKGSEGQVKKFNTLRVVAIVVSIIFIVSLAVDYIQVYRNEHPNIFSRDIDIYSSFPAPQPTHHFESKVLGYSIDYPDNWTTEISGESSWSFGPGRNTAYTPITITISKESISFFEGIYRKDDEVLQKQQVSINNVDWTKFTVKTSQQETFYSFLTNINNRTYKLDSAPDAEVDSVAQQMLNSIKFIK